MLLEIKNLSVSFDNDEGELLSAVKDVSLSLDRGEILGLVGESGCGKSVTAMSIVRLLPSPPAKYVGGKILFDGEDTLSMPLPQLRKLRGKRIGVIFQDPMNSLSPLHRIGEQLVEMVLLHTEMSKAAARDLALEWLEKVGIPDPAIRAKAYPHELSGGMQQRVMIAMGLMLEPDLIIADEPTTALDVTIQAQILRLMKRLHRINSGVLLITHDMGVVSQMATKIAVMYAGEVVETAENVSDFFANPKHPYSRALLQSIPSALTRGKRLPVIPGNVPPIGSFKDGCRFADRCAFSRDECFKSNIPLKSLGNENSVRCLFN
ncbi:MAG: ABC transporter ATP-binding protein [Kiritimatiellae bacterium]|nr:ABC transporter ATP-binding protein [Kiritimatiellia bacterium]